MPRVSVVIATYKRPEALQRAVRAALAQTLTDLEVIVVTERDDTVSGAALAAIDDARVRHLVNPEKGGPGVARDFGVADAGGDFIAFLDDDDDWVTDKLEKQIAAAPDDTTIVTSLSRVVTDAGEFIRPTRPYAAPQPIDEWLFDRNSWFKGGEVMLQTSSLMLPRSLFDTLRFGQSRHEEWELVIRAVKQLGYRLVTVMEPLVSYYALNTVYPWRPSVIWVDGMRDVMTPRAISGFSLTVATQGLVSPERNLAAMTFFRIALRHGKPTARQLFAFVAIWATPYSLRHRARATLRELHFMLSNKRGNDGK